MEGFLDTLELNQLINLADIVNTKIRERVVLPSPPTAPRKNKYPPNSRIIITNIAQMPEKYNDLRNEIINLLGDIRSNSIYVSKKKELAKIKFNTQEDANNALILLVDEFGEKDVKIY